MCSRLTRQCRIVADVLLLLPIMIWGIHCAEVGAPPVGDYPPVIDDGPALSILAPNTGAPGTVVTATGDHFAPAREENIVMFGGTRATVLDVKVDPTGPDSLTTVVPFGLHHGIVDVTVEVNGKVSNSLDFYISLVPGENLTNALEPYDVAVDEVRGRVFVVNRKSDSVSVLRKNSAGRDSVRNIPVGDYPESVAVDPQTGLAYVADRGSDEISMIDPDQDFRVSAFSAGPGSAPTFVKINPRERVLYVANAGNGTVGVFSLETREWTHVLPVGECPGEIALDLALQRLYVVCEQSATVTAYRWPAYDDRDDVAVNALPWALDVHEGSHRVYVVCRGAWDTGESGSVAILDGTALEVLGNIVVGEDPYDVVVSQTSHEVFVANSLSDTVSVIDGARMELARSISVGKDPWAMAIYQAANRLLVVNAYGKDGGTGSVSIVDTARKVELRQIDVGAWPSAVAIALQTETAYVANASSASLSVIENISGFPRRDDRPLGIVPGRMALDTGSGELVVGSVNGAISVVPASLSSFASAAVGVAISDVVVDEKRGLIYATDTADDRLWVLNKADLAVAGSIRVGRGPMRILLDPDRDKAFVANFVGRSLSVVDLNTQRERDRWNGGGSPSEMALCPQAGRLFVISQSALEEDGHLVVLDADSEEVVKRVRRPGRWGDLRKVAVDVERQWLYAVNSGGPSGNEDPSVTVLDCSSGEILASVVPGIYPTDVAIRPEDGRVFVPNFLDSTVSVIGPDHDVIDTVPVGMGPSSVAYDAALDVVFVHHRSEATLWTVDAGDFSTLSVTHVGKPCDSPRQALLLNDKTHQVWVMDPEMGGIYVFPGPELAAGSLGNRLVNGLSSSARTAPVFNEMTP